MRRQGKAVWIAGAVVLTLAVLQARMARAAGAEESSLHKIAYVAQGVADRVVGLVSWASAEVWGAPSTAGVTTDVREAQEGDFQWSGRVAPGDVIEIKGVSGDIEADRAAGSTVEVVAQKRARRSDVDEVHIEVVEHAGGVTICAVYPGRGNACEPGSGGSNNVRDNDVRVSFQIRVPEGVNLRARTVNGDVRVDGLEDSDVDAATVNGGLELWTSGSVEAATVNGSIDARMASASWSGTLEFATVNGSISLDVPDDLNADVEASWVNGGIETDLPFTIRGRISRQHAEGSLGQGGPPIELSTVNGSIRIH